MSETRPGTALCLSGGGYRAMVFHIGVLWRLHDSGLLRTLTRISSVSGGSIAAGALALAWPRLGPGPGDTGAFVEHVVDPIRRLAGTTIDASSVLRGLFLPGSVSTRIASAYRKHLFGRRTLADLPDEPRFVINATNIQSGALWRFSKPYMRDWRVGEVRNPGVELADAVAASSAFPPVLSPVTLPLDPSRFTPDSGTDMQQPPYTSRAVLSDGGVYDNLGLETTDDFETILVSDAGGKLQPDPSPRSDWVRHSVRVLEVIDNQVRSLRKRQLIAQFRSGARQGAYWGIRTNVDDYGLATAMPCPFERTLELANVPTRLKAMDATLQERLINWGYAVSDAALRAHVDADLLVPDAFPYNSIGV